MNKAGITMLIAGFFASLALPSISSANDFTTVTRVKYVQNCIASNHEKMNIYEATSKCSCVIDELAKSFTQTEFEDIDTGYQYRNIPGDNGQAIKDDADVNDGIIRFKEAHAEAYKSCRMR